jgi:hypothetical protein
MIEQKVTGRTIRIGPEVFIITCDKAVPRHYLVAATFLVAMLLLHLLRGEIVSVQLYAGAIALATLGLSWLFDDRETYRLRKVMELPMPVADAEENRKSGAQE